LAEKIPSIVVAKINVDKYTRFRSKYGVRYLFLAFASFFLYSCTADLFRLGEHMSSAYPTLKLFIKGFPLDYNGPRQASSLSSHLEKLAHPDVEVLKTEVELEAFLRQRDRNLPIFICFGIQSLMVADLAKEHKSQAWFVFLEEFSEKAMDVYDFDRGPAIVALSVTGEEDVFYGPFTSKYTHNFSLPLSCFTL
jgi:protein disulfide-isomerase A1